MWDNVPPAIWLRSCSTFWGLKLVLFPAACENLTFCWDTNPVEIASQLLGDVSLPPGWEANHHYHSGRVGKLWPTGYEKEEKAKHKQLLIHQLIFLIAEPASSRSFWSYRETKKPLHHLPCTFHPWASSDQNLEQGNPPIQFQNGMCWMSTSELEHMVDGSMSHEWDNCPS